MHYVFYPNVLLKVLCVLLQSLSTLWEDGKVLFLLRLSGRVKNDDDMYFVLFPPLLHIILKTKFIVTLSQLS